MNKAVWIACIFVFIVVTAFVLSIDGTTTTKRVKFTNQNLEITHENTEVVNSDNVKFDFAKSNIDNKEINATNQDLDINSVQTNINNSGEFNNQDTSFVDETVASRSQTNFNNSGNEFSNQKINYKNLDDSNLDDLLSNAENNKTNHTNLNSEPIRNDNPDRYGYKNLDWNSWHSNFVNKILDDSVDIHELDNYGEGTWFYYSFNVHKNGAISNISVKSMYLKYEDKQRVADLIKSYQYKSITIFPKDSKRQVAKVSAVVMLSNSSKYANPNDFSDSERVKFKY